MTLLTLLNKVIIMHNIGIFLVKMLMKKMHCSRNIYLSVEDDDLKYLHDLRFIYIFGHITIYRKMFSNK